MSTPQLAPSQALALLAIALLAAACSSSSPGNVDLGSPDRARVEGGADSAARDRHLADRGTPENGKSDVTKPPARWELIPGASLKIEEHTATLLKDGRVLVAGGRQSPSTATGEAYLYDPVANAFQKTTPMAVQRWNHSATRLQDGRVLVAGGNAPGTSGVLDSTEIFDPASASWSLGPVLPGPRSGHLALLLGNGDLLLVAGYSGLSQLSSLCLLPAGTASWTQPAAALTSKRAGHTATLLANGKVLIAGGYDGTYLDTIEVFDPGTGLVTALTAKLTEPRAAATASRLPNGKVLIVGGQHCNGTACPTAVSDDLYDPATDTVAGITHPGGAPVFHAAAELQDGRVLISGGEASKTTKAVLFSSAGIVGWTVAPDLKVGRYKHTATMLLDGSVLVVGGLKVDGTFVEEAERFYP